MTLNFPAPPPAPDLNQPDSFNQRVLDMFTWCSQTMPAFLDGLDAADFFQVQSSPLDTDQGKVLAPGAFGLGVVDGVTAPGIADLDSAPSGLGRISGTTLGTLPAGATSGAVFTAVNQVGRTSQILFGVNSNRIFTRTKHDDTWRDWTEIVSLENLIGTVSQTGGVPTGAVIERGANANGEYVRLADGTQMCWRECPIDVGSVAAQSFSFPADFSDGAGGPAGVSDVCTSWSHQISAPHGSLETANIRSAGHTNLAFVIRLKTADTSVDPAARTERMMAMAVGRWF